VATLERERRNSEDPERIAVINGALEVLRDDKFSKLRQDLKPYQERVRTSEIGLMGARQEIERAMKFYVLRHKTFARHEERHVAEKRAELEKQLRDCEKPLEKLEAGQQEAERMVMAYGRPDNLLR
jgi:hypothetical protein